MALAMALAMNYAGLSHSLSTSILLLGGFARYIVTSILSHRLSVPIMVPISVFLEATIDSA